VASEKPAYGNDAHGDYESRAYDLGYSLGYAGKALTYTALATTYPNAFHRGYWDGVADMNGEHA
jgi:hypothetical protein